MRPREHFVRVRVALESVKRKGDLDFLKGSRNSIKGVLEDLEEQWGC
jgi:hypothetical protein